MGFWKYVVLVYLLFLAIGTWASPLYSDASTSAGTGNRPALILVPRVDGVITAVEALTGKLLWNFSTGGPLVQADVELGDGDMDPVLDANELLLLNAIQRDGLQDLYPEANSVLGATPFMSEDGTIFLSHKQSKRFVVDLLTGLPVLNEAQNNKEPRTWPKEAVDWAATSEVSSASWDHVTTSLPGSGSTSLPGPGSTSFPGSGSTSLPGSGSTSLPGSGSTFLPGSTCQDSLHVVRTAHTLETHNTSRLSSRSLTVSNLRAFLLPCLKPLSHFAPDPEPLPILSSSRFGDLMAYDPRGKLLWIFRLPAPHCQIVYFLSGNTLRAIRPAQPVEPLQKVPLSLTHYKGTPYEVPFGVSEHKQLALPAPVDVHGDSYKSVWYWIATICICTTAAIWGLVLLRHQSRSSSPVPSHTRPSSSVPRSDSSLRLREEHKELQQQLKDLITLQQKQQEKHLQQAQQLQELQQLQEQQLQQKLQQHQQQLLQHQQLLQTQLQPSLLQPSQSSDLPKTVSRYRADFEEKERLGEGGFGTVFLAINKLDGVEYAIKKVCLTSGNAKESARVLREVRYLALLDHPNIIRYFQSWVEEEEWDEWDECRIGSRLDYYDDECDGEDEDQSADEQRADEEQKGNGRSAWNDSDDYEGDESALSRGNSSRSSSSVVSIGFTTSSVGLATSSIGFCTDGTSVEAELHRKRTKMPLGMKPARLRNLRRLQIDRPQLSLGVDADNDDKLGNNKLENNNKPKNVDGTCSRSVGSTSDPMDEESFSAGSKCGPLRCRKPILYIQMQYCHQGTLHNWLSRTDRAVCAQEAISIFRQAVQGVAHIHYHSVIHRDLKPPNILISADGSVKIGDFGLSTGGNVDTLPQSPTRVLNRSHTTGVGSPLYCSPEQLKGEHYDSKVDIFSLGIILYEMFHIFSTQMERISHITNLRDFGHINDQTRALYPELADLTLQLVQPDPSLRPRAKDILSRPFLLPPS